MTGRSYVGTELDLFASAVRWKSYFARRIRPFLGRDVLEVGAGIGATTAVLAAGPRREWLCLEPDPELVARIDGKIRQAELPDFCRVRAGIVADLEERLLFDTILYIDVLEHIPDDRLELERAARHLRLGGFLVVLSPAGPRLFSPFDEAVGHCRRYTRTSLARAVPDGGRIVRLWSLDAAGMFASMANAAWLRQSAPSERQILFWDRTLVPLAPVIDRLTAHRAGRSILCVWERLP